ncbi:ribosome maturation factor RimM [Marinilactibacillus piezotolerans]|uniref:ribosome maturation factor RimM n=1 Tax=Marinilactibacillus piezotolerans TaxID=258723 RepID=UPI0009B13C79|nr:ribosome maturation factor RimM [Marinilactibacillus piezotolerans]
MMEFYDVGKVVNTHGLKGEVRVISITNTPEERYFTGASLIWFGENGEQVELIVRSHRVHKNFDLVAFEDYPTINEVEQFVGGMLRVGEDQLLELNEDEFYLHEIIGCTVVDEDGNELGKVKEVLSPGANDVWVVQRQNKRDLLLPYIESVILDVDIENQVVKAFVMEGLDD